MSYLQRIEECNQYNMSNFKPVIFDRQIVGWMKHAFAEELRRWPGIFDVTPDSVLLMPKRAGDSGFATFNQKNEALEEVNLSLVEAGVINQTHGELYPVKTDFYQPDLMLIDRAAATYYGIRAWGQHLNGYVEQDGQLLMWIGKRSSHKHNFPGMLDNMVAGGLPYGISLADNIVKECQEEASVEPHYLATLKPVGAISYCVETNNGIKPDTLFCYDLKLPSSFQPVCQDGEVEEFMLLPLDDVAELVRDTTRFKPNCDLTIIDFLIRHGYIQPDERDYLRLVSGLRGYLLSQPPFLVR